MPDQTDLRAAIKALRPRPNLQGSPVSAWCDGRDAAAALIPEHHPHPGEAHQFRTTCERCGEPGALFVAVLGPTEEARITERQQP